MHLIKQFYQISAKIIINKCYSRYLVITNVDTTQLEQSVCDKWRLKEFINSFYKYFLL